MKTISLTQNKIAWVDDDDYERLNQYKWHAIRYNTKYYPTRHEHKKGKQRRILMHRQILNVPAGMDCDHKDHDGLHNGRDNLRIATRAENCRNRRPYKIGTSRYKGVCWHRRSSKWCARIRVQGRLIHLGMFFSETKAALAYDKAAHNYFRQFAYSNF